MTIFAGASLGFNFANLTELSGLFSATLIPTNVNYGSTDVTYDIVFGTHTWHVDFEGAFTGQLQGGTMTGIHVTFDGNPYYNITGFSAPVQNLLNAASSSNVMGFFYGLFGGGDVIVGAPATTNFMWGIGSGHDVIIGGGKGAHNFIHEGFGYDSLIGQSHDTFIFDNKISKAAAVDTVFNYNHSIDRICLAEHLRIGFQTSPNNPHLFFWTGEKLGALDAKYFHLGTHALNRLEHVIYDQAHGNLYFDPDGSGRAPQVLVAHFDGNPHLTYHDFTIIA